MVSQGKDEERPRRGGQVQNHLPEGPSPAGIDHRPDHTQVRRAAGAVIMNFQVFEVRDRRQNQVRGPGGPGQEQVVHRQKAQVGKQFFVPVGGRPGHERVGSGHEQVADRKGLAAFQRPEKHHGLGFFHAPGQNRDFFTAHADPAIRISAAPRERLQRSAFAPQEQARVQQRGQTGDGPDGLHAVGLEFQTVARVDVHRNLIEHERGRLLEIIPAHVAALQEVVGVQSGQVLAEFRPAHLAVRVRAQSFGRFLQKGQSQKPVGPGPGRQVYFRRPGGFRSGTDRRPSGAGLFSTRP